MTRLAAPRTPDGRLTPEYTAWLNMKNRCYNPRYKNFNIYGGAGIYVCQRWRDSFANFLEDLGPRPSSAHSLDRICERASYMPGNCQWATVEEQNAVGRRKIPVTNTSGKLGVNYDTSKGVWRARIGIKGVRTTLYEGPSKDAAVTARLQAEQALGV